MPQKKSTADPSIPKNVHFLTPDELASFFHAIQVDQDDLRSRSLALFGMMYILALRVPEVLRIKMDDINFDKGSVLIRRVFGPAVMLDLPSGLVSLISSWLVIRPDSDFLFPSSYKDNAPLQDDRLRLLFQKFAQEAGIPEEKRKLSVFRHTSGLRLAQSGKSIPELKRILGLPIFTQNLQAYLSEKDGGSLELPSVVAQKFSPAKMAKPKLKETRS